MVRKAERTEQATVDLLSEQLRRRITDFDGKVFAGALLLAFAAHFYMFTNKFVNHDDVGDVLSRIRFGVIYGRWFLNIISELGGDFSSPWLNGGLGAVFLSLGAVFTVKLFRVRHLLPALLMAGVMVTFPVVASTYTYMFVAYQFFFALAMAALGAWCICREKLPWLGLGALCVAVSTGTYQAYFAFAAVLVLTAYLSDLCTGRWENDWKRSLAAGLKYVGTLALGMLLYFAVMKLSLAVTGQKLVEYQGIDEMGIRSLDELLRRIQEAYRGYFSFYLNRTGIFHKAIIPLSFTCMGLGLAGAILSLLKNGVWKHPLCLLMAAVCAALFPLASSLTNVMSAAGTHTVMQYSMVVTLLLPGILADRCPLPAGKSGQRFALSAVSALLLLELLCGYEGWLLCNRSYFYLDLTYENLYSYATRLAAKVELQEGYTQDSEVAMIGTHVMGSPVPVLSMTGVFSGDSAPNIYSWRLYLQNYLAARFREPPAGILASIRYSEEFQSMPEYPAAGSIRSIQGVIVVKLHQEG